MENPGFIICSRIFEFLLCTRSPARYEGYSNEQARQGPCCVKAVTLVVTWGRRRDPCGLSRLTSGLCMRSSPSHICPAPPLPSLWSPLHVSNSYSSSLSYHFSDSPGCVRALVLQSQHCILLPSNTCYGCDFTFICMII